MQKNSHDFSLQEAMRLAKSPVGKQIMQKLQQSDPNLMNQISNQVKEGNYTQAMSTLKNILSTPEVQKLLNEFGE